MARARIERLVEGDLPSGFFALFEGSADPDLALANFERWLKSTSSPGIQLQHLLQLPKLAGLVVLLMGASQPLADALIQNPELATLVTESLELEKRPEVARISEEGRRLLEAASGYSHALDRLRFIKQSWMLRIAVNDLAGYWEQEDVWRALSDLADALIGLTFEASWREFCAQKGLRGACPVGLVAFGKLGGKELNYSSDVDLVYVLDDGLTEASERHAARFCEMLTRALSERMGRGALYRVDLRLRPFGRAGPVAPTMRAVEGYYRSYAETWETQALIRSRPVCGPREIAERWSKLRGEHCFRPQVSSAAIEEVLAMRRRMEGAASEPDLKRGAGGIRDVEFLVQVLQMVHGHDITGARDPNTLKALQALLEAGKVSANDAVTLAEGYRFLRKLEHRCQIVGDRQTHAVPASQEGRDRLASLMGEENWKGLERALNRHRNAIRAIYEAAFALDTGGQDPRQAVLAQLGSAASPVRAWFDALPASDAFYRSLAENRDSLGRVRRIIEDSPALVPYLGRSLALTESLISGEIEEGWNPGAEIAALPIETPLPRVAEALRGAWVRAAARWQLGSGEPLGPCLTELYDALIRHAARRIYAEFDVIALGSYGTRDLGLASDLDLLWLVENPARHADAEAQAEQMLSLFGSLRRHGAPVEVDLRLRPEGSKGLLARTYEGLRSYELQGMEMWERFALGQSRLVLGDPSALTLVKKCAYALPLTPERLDELVRLKERIERERVSAKHRKRHVKLGVGGLADIEWFVHLHEMRYPTAAQAGLHEGIPDRIRSLARAQLINAIERDVLLAARQHLLATRERLVLLGFTTDVVPENPDKLDRLAAASGYKDGYAFLKEHEGVTRAVRDIYLEGLERLRA